MLVSAIILVIFVLAAVLLKPRYEKRISKDTATLIITLICMALLLALDRTSKIEMPVFLEGKGTVDLIPGIIGLHLLPGGNTGAAWGLFSGNTWMLIGMTFLVIVAAFYCMFVKKFYSFWTHAAVALVTAGGIGNLYDRIVYGSVVDFFEFQFIEFPIFNVADCYIVTGAVLLIASVLFAKKDEPLFVKAKAEEKANDPDPDSETEAAE